MTLHKHRKKTCKNSGRIATEFASNTKHAQAKTLKINTWARIFFIGGNRPLASPPGPTPLINTKTSVLIGANRHVNAAAGPAPEAFQLTFIMRKGNEMKVRIGNAGAGT